MRFSSRIHLSFCKQHTFSFETQGSEYYSLKCKQHIFSFETLGSEYYSLKYKQLTFPLETLGSEYYSLKFGYVHLIGIGGLGRCGGAHEVFTT